MNALDFSSKKTKKDGNVTLAKLCITTVIKKATIAVIIPSQKTSSSLSNLRIGD